MAYDQLTAHYKLEALAFMPKLEIRIIRYKIYKPLQYL